MVLSGPFSWTSLGKDVPVSVVPDPNASAKSVIVTTASIAPCMMYWLKVPILPEFKIDGAPILNQFEIEFLK